jgi:hypothetical protein
MSAMLEGEKAGQMAHQISRRDFAFLLAAGAEVVIGGYFLVPHAARAARQGKAEIRPCLRVPVPPEDSEGMTRIAVGEGDAQIACAVNRVGAGILHLLDGTRTVQQVAVHTARRLAVRRDEAFDAKVACFVAEVAQLGFLTAPFYVNIVERATHS